MMSIIRYCSSWRSLRFILCVMIFSIIFCNASIAGNASDSRFLHIGPSTSISLGAHNVSNVSQLPFNYTFDASRYPFDGSAGYSGSCFLICLQYQAGMIGDVYLSINGGTYLPSYVGYLGEGVVNYIFQFPYVSVPVTYFNIHGHVVPFSSSASGVVDFGVIKALDWFPIANMYPQSGYAVYDYTVHTDLQNIYNTLSGLSGSSGLPSMNQQLLQTAQEQLNETLTHTQILQNQLIESQNQTSIQSEQLTVEQEMLDIANEDIEEKKSFFEKCIAFFTGFFDNLMNSIKSLFIPEDDYFEDFFSRLNQLFEHKLGMLYAPLGLFVDVLTAILDSSVSNVGIPFPGIKWGDVYIVEPMVFSFDSIFESMPELQERIYFVTNVIMVGAVIYLLQQKLREVLTT